MPITSDTTFRADYEVEWDPWPVRGTFHEFHGTDRGHGDTYFQVRPFSSAPWLGRVRFAISSSSEGLTGFATTPDPLRLLLLARGDAYLINVAEPAAYQTLRVQHPSVALMAAPEVSLLIVASPWDVAAIDSTGARWRTRRVAMDGIRLGSVVDGFLHGIADPDDEARSFRVDLRDGEAHGGYSDTEEDRASNAG